MDRGRMEVRLVLQNSQECPETYSVNPELGSGQNISVLGLNPVVVGKLEPAIKESVEYPTGWGLGGKET